MSSLYLLVQAAIFLTFYGWQTRCSGMAYSSPSVKWGFALLAVLKPWKGNYGLQWIFVLSSSLQLFIMSPCPIWKMKWSHYQSLRFLVSFELSHKHWQLNLNQVSCSCQSFLIPETVYTAIRVLNGTTNAIPQFQSSLAAEVPHGLSPALMERLDNISFHCKTYNSKSVPSCRTMGCPLISVECRITSDP